MAKAKVEFIGDSAVPPKRRAHKFPKAWGFLVVVVLGLGFALYSWNSKPEMPKVQATEHPEVILTIHGSNTLGAALLPSLAEAFLKNLGAQKVMQQSGNSEVEKTLIAELPGKTQPVVIEIEAHGSSTGFSGLDNGNADIAASSRPVKQDEAERLARRGMGIMTSQQCETVIALDGVAVIVHPENPISRLEVETVARIFSGEVKRWEELELGHEGYISVYARDQKSGTFDTFQSLLLGKTRVLNNWAVRFEDSVMLYESVMSDPQAIGFIGLPYIRQAKVLAISEPGARAFRPNYLSVKSEDYALSRRLFLYKAEQSSNPYADAFIAFSRSDEGQRLVRQANLIDLSLGVDIPQLAKNSPEGSQKYQSLVRNAEFVVTVRFNPNDETLDNRALDDLGRFLKLMSLPENRQRQVILAGHTDTSGDEQENLVLSKMRAEVVAKQLANQGISSIVAEGFGVEIPVASNESPKGRQKNRRVEIYLGV